MSQLSRDQGGESPPLDARVPLPCFGVSVGYQGTGAPSPQLLVVGSPSPGRTVPADSPASPTKTSWGGLGGPSPTALYTLMRIS